MKTKTAIRILEHSENGVKKTIKSTSIKKRNANTKKLALTVFSKNSRILLNMIYLQIGKTFYQKCLTFSFLV